MATKTAQTISDVLDSLVAQAIENDVPRSVAEEAAAVTARTLRTPPGNVAPQTRRRAEAYFSAVVRRRVVRRGSSARAAARFVVAAVVEDLRSTGRSGADIWDELQRGWSGQVPGDVLEEYRMRLCS